MAKMPAKVIEKINDMSALKFMATVDGEGNPNVVCISSLIAADEETLVYANLMGVKTPKNLLRTRKVAVNVYAPDPGVSFQIKGEFVEFISGGPIFEAFTEHPALKYDPVFGVKSVGVIKVREVYSAGGYLPGRRIVPPEPYFIDEGLSMRETHE
jgi:predicted pyridoxine 5'-phosphate oxidase superfamily flavin-nucleotide-binding protein